MSARNPSRDGGDPTRLESHFAFGENWQSFLLTVTEDSIAEAARGLERLLPADEIRGRRMLDIGCGSGLAMLAACRLGARSVDGVDLDPNSVEAAQTLLAKHRPQGGWSTRVASAFDLAPAADRYDIVHSWGVLHHTGDMWAALDRAAALVAPGGHLIVALYRKTPLCGFWKREKSFYAAAGRGTQALIRALYSGIYVAGLMATARNPIRYVRDYRTARGMDFFHNVHDWLGGHPYESVEPQAVEAFLERWNFRLVRSFEKPAPIAGLLGSHCDEFVAVRRD